MQDKTCTTLITFFHTRLCLNLTFKNWFLQIFLKKKHRLQSNQTILQNVIYGRVTYVIQCCLFMVVTGSASASACAVVHYRLITYATYMRVQAPHVHPGTAAVNQTACNFPIKGRAFAIALHSKPEKPTVNISNRNYKISKTVCSILDPRKALTFHYKF